MLPRGTSLPWGQAVRRELGYLLPQLTGSPLQQGYQSSRLGTPLPLVNSSPCQESEFRPGPKPFLTIIHSLGSTLSLPSSSIIFITSHHYKVHSAMGQGGGSRPALGLGASSLSPARWRHMLDGRSVSGQEWHSCPAAACVTELPFLGCHAAHPVQGRA